MPGMMDTILNLGLNDKTVIALAKATNNERFAYDSYRRFIQMFSDVAMEVPKYKFENVLDNYKEENNFKFDTDLTCEHLKSIVEEYKAIYKKEVGEDFPQDPKKEYKSQAAYDKENGYDFTWSYGDEVQCKVTANNEKYFCVMLSGYTYEGGAHGNYKPSGFESDGFFMPLSRT